MNYKELCELLNNNKEQKDVFFRNVNAPEFLPYFIKYDVLNFDNDCGASVISYLTKILQTNSEFKNDIITIINDNLKNYQNMSGYVFDSLLQLLKQFTIEDIENNIDYTSLFKMDNAWIFDEFLLQQDISNTQILYPKCVESLVSYKQYEDPVWKTKQAVSIHGIGIYTISKLFSEQPYKDNLEKILQKKDIFDLLLEQYNKIYSEIGDLSIIDRQYIKAIQPIEENRVSYDIRNIILNCCIIHIEKNNSKKLIQNLLKSEIPMLQKLGLYAISLNVKDYKKEFINFFNNFKINNVQYYIYELMSILQDHNIDEEVCKSIYDKITNIDKHLKYRFLHALKNQPLYKDEFLLLLNEYGSEIDNPNIIFSLKTSSPTNVSPISKKEFIKKSIKEQISYLNAYEAPLLSNLSNTNDTLESEDELYKIFKEVLISNFNTYIQDDSMFNLEKPNVISVFFDAISSAIIDKKEINISRVLELLKEYLTKDTKLETFHFKCTKMLADLIRIADSKEDSNKLFMIIETQIKKWQRTTHTKISNNLALDNVRLPLGQYIKTWLYCWIKNKNIFQYKHTFLKKNFNTKAQLANQLLYYNIGTYYGWLNNDLENLPNNETLLNAFIEGLINNNQERNLQSWKNFKKSILLYFKQLDKDENNMIRKNFLYSLIHINFVLKDEDLFKFFYNDFELKDKEDFLWNVLYPIRNPKYNKKQILNYWNTEVNSQGNISPKLLLSMFNEYAEIEDFNIYLNDLEKLFKLYSSRPENSIKNLLELEDFLENFIDFINNIETNEDLQISIFNLLNSLIPIFSKYEFISTKEAMLLKNILESYYKGFKTENNLKILLEKIYTTKNLIQYSDIFQEINKNQTRDE